MRAPRVLAVLLAAWMALWALPLSAGAAETGFDDVGETDWYAPAVQYAVEHRLFQGTDARHFSSEAPMTRGMFVTVLGRLCGVDAGQYPESFFLDVKTSQYFSPYVQWAASYEIVNGVGEYSFAPGASITREEIAVMLYRFAAATGNETSFLPGFVGLFRDGETIHSWAKDAMEWAVSHGVLAGYGGELSPRGTATRAQYKGVTGAAFLKGYPEAEQ